MAKSSYFSRNSKFRGRRLFLLLAFVTVIALALWRVLFYSPSTDSENSSSRSLSSQVQTKQPAPSNHQPTSDASTADTQVKSESAAAPPEAISEQSVTPEHEPLQHILAQQVPHQDGPAEQNKTANEPTNKQDFQGAQRLLQEGQAALNHQQYLIAREKLSRAVEMGLTGPQDKQACALLNKTTDIWLFSKAHFPQDTFCQRYKVASGDRLATIGRKFNVPYQVLARINNISDPTKLRAGQTIKVINGPFHAVVNRSKFQMQLYLGDLIVRCYPISLGKPGRDTPTGRWLIQAGKKQVNPAWTDPDTGQHYYPDDPDNPLGERWIGMEGLDGDALGRTGFGIHGTIEPEKIGTGSSRGCIRLRNKDVEELFDILTEGKSQVQVVD